MKFLKNIFFFFQVIALCIELHRVLVIKIYRSFNLGQLEDDNEKITM